MDPKGSSSDEDKDGLKKSRSTTKVGKKRRRRSSAGRRRSRVRRTPVDDALQFSKVALPSKERKTQVIVIHGDPSKPNPILPGGKWDEDDFEAIDILKQALEKLKDTFDFQFQSNHDTLIRDLKKRLQFNKADMVLQLCDEGYMNNPRMELHITALLETIGIPYTGTGPIGLGFTSDKQAVLTIARELGIPTPLSVYVEKDAEVFKIIEQHKLEYPLFVKPNHTDGSFGITTKSICRSEQDVLEAIKMIRDTFHIPGPILIQEFLEGTDLNTAIIGNPQYKHMFLPVTEEDYSSVPTNLPRVLGFEAKWDEHSPYFRIGTIKAKSVDEETQKFMNECSAKLFTRIALRDYARFDWKLDKYGKPRLLEANPNCGWSYDAHLQRMCALADITYSQMIRMIIDAAQLRIVEGAKIGRLERYVRPEDITPQEMRESSKQVSSNMSEGPLKL